MRLATSALLIVGLLFAGCGGSIDTAGAGGGDEATPAPTEATETGAPATEEPMASEEPELTPEPESDAPATYKAGDVITLTKDGDPWAEVTITKVATKKQYKDGYYTDKPKKGNVYIQALVTYKALENGVDYNPFDWQVFANGEAVENFSVVMNGPEPSLSSGTLPKGRVAKGWVVYEVPAKGQVLMSYTGNIFMDEAPVFEVVLRAK